MGKRGNDNLSMEQHTNKQSNNQTNITKKSSCHNGPAVCILRFSKPRLFNQVCRLGECAVGISIHFPDHVLHNHDPGSAGALFDCFCFLSLKVFGGWFLCVCVCLWKSLKKRYGAKCIALCMKLNLRPKIRMSVIFHFPLVML